MTETSERRNTSPPCTGELIEIPCTSRREENSHARQPTSVHHTLGYGRGRDGAVGGRLGGVSRAGGAETVVHPFAGAQPTATGRKINTLHAHRGRLYTGYGDANNYGGGNTGPIHIASFDPVTATWQDHLTFGTEKVSRYRVVGGNLATTANDPRAGNEFIAIEDARGLWASVNTNVRQLHVYDVCGELARRVVGLGLGQRSVLPAGAGMAFHRRWCNVAAGVRSGPHRFRGRRAGNRRPVLPHRPRRRYDNHAALPRPLQLGAPGW